MGTTIYLDLDPTLKSIEFGAVYQIHAPRTGEPWALHKTADNCGVNSIEPLEVPDGWDDAYEYWMGDMGVRSRIIRVAHDAYLFHAILEVALVPVYDEGARADSCALLYRFTWPY